MCLAPYQPWIPPTWETITKTRATTIVPNRSQGSDSDSKLRMTSAMYSPTRPKMHPLAPTTIWQGSSKTAEEKFPAIPTWDERGDLGQPATLRRDFEGSAGDSEGLRDDRTYLR